jgi:hypothetical protein
MRLPIVVLSCLLIVIVVVIYNHFHVDNMVAALKDQSAVKRIEVFVSCPSGSREIVLTDRPLLDTIGRALMLMKETDAQQGGEQTLWARVTVYKKNKKVEFFVSESPYNGWMIIVFNRSYESDFMFNLIKSYCKH